ncbi:MAG: ABC transporter substrate-binding protein [Rhodospirillales bacterium]|nr:ABC transporter substrate-binding protein [Rhodospirillales bacterium]
MLVRGLRRDETKTGAPRGGSRPWRVALAAALLAGTISAAHAQQAPIKIGVLNDQSALYADFGGKGSVEAARMAVEDFGGKVLGRPIEIVSADHQNKPDVASAIARQWFDAEGVHAITDLTNSAVAIAVQTLAKERGKVTLFTGPATTRLINEDCSPTGFMWNFDTYTQAIGTGKAIVAEGGKTWFLLVADYAFGHQMAADLRNVVTAGGGKVLGEVKHPVNNADFSSFLLQAQASKAQVIGLSNAGADTINAIKQAGEFRIAEAGQTLAGLVVVISDVHSLGLQATQGLYFTTAFYWDTDDKTRAWSKRFFDRMGRMPGAVHAATYSSVSNYLKAMEAAGTDEGPKVAEKLRSMEIDDFFGKGRVRADGRFEHGALLAQVKSPSESKAPWDYFKIVRRISAEEAVQPLSESKCPLVKK